MRKIVHLPDSSFYSELISNLTYDNDTLIYNELTDEMFRFVLPIDVNQTFDSWKDNLPKYSYAHRGNITSSTGFGDLSASYGSYDTDEIFSSELAPYFSLELNVYWQKKIGGSNHDIGQGIAVDGNGNIYLNGEQRSDVYGDYDYGVIKLDSDGNILWQKKIGGGLNDRGYGIAVDGSGNVYLNGTQSSSSHGGTDYGVIKLDSSGNEVWQKRIGGTGSDNGTGIAVDSSGNVYLSGGQESDGYNDSWDYGVIKLDTNGNILWQKRIGGLYADVGNAIAVDSSGNVYVNGYATPTSNNNVYGVVKFDTNGNLLWKQMIGGSGTDQGWGIAVDDNENVYLNGMQSSDVFGQYDYGVIKLNQYGTATWRLKIGGFLVDNGKAIAVDSSGNVYLNGYQKSYVYGEYDYGVVKLDSSGNLLWQKKIGGVNYDSGNSIAVDNNGDVYVNGSIVYDSTYHDYGVIKMKSDQESDMNFSIAGAPNLTVSQLSVIVADMNLSISDMSLSIGDMNLSIDDIDISGDAGGLVYIG